MVARNLNQTVYVAGHRGMVGSALVRRLTELGYRNILTPGRELDLVNQAAVGEFFAAHKIDQVFLAAGRVGGIHANSTYPAEFIYENLMIEANVINTSHIHDVNKLMFLGSSCIYPRHAKQPIPEESLLNGALEPTNEPYAVAKIAGIKLCESYKRQYGNDYRSVMPTNLYGPNDNFHPTNSHVIPALLRRFHDAIQERAEEIVIWGSGKPSREFLHVDDMAAATVHLMELESNVFDAIAPPTGSFVNVGTGSDCSIQKLAEIIASVTGFQGQLTFDNSKPDGPPRKLLDVTRLNNSGWHASIELSKGLAATYAWYVTNISSARNLPTC